MNKTVYIILGIIAAGAIVALGFFLSYRNQAENPQNTGSLPGVSGGAFSGTNNTPPAQTPSTNGANQAGLLPNTTESLSVAVNSPIRDYFVNEAGDITFVARDGQILKAVGGKTVVMRKTPMPGLQKTAFSPDGKKLLLLNADTTGFTFSLFDTVSSTIQSLRVQGIDAAWAPASNNLAILAVKKNIITISLLDTTKASALPKTILTLHANDLTIRWQDDKHILIIPKPSALVDGTILSFDITTNKLVPLENGLGVELAWGKTANQGLSFVAGDQNKGGRLALIGADGAQMHALSFLTLPTKCTFHEEAPLIPVATSTIATTSTSTKAKKIAPLPTPPSVTFLDCAIPRDAGAMAQAVLPDDYEQKALTTQDSFYKINIENGAIVDLFSNELSKLDATMLRAAAHKLFFVNRLDQKLYSLKLY